MRSLRNREKCGLHTKLYLFFPIAHENFIIIRVFGRMLSTSRMHGRSCILKPFYLQQKLSANKQNSFHCDTQIRNRQIISNIRYADDAVLIAD